MSPLSGVPTPASIPPTCSAQSALASFVLAALAASMRADRRRAEASTEPGGGPFDFIIVGGGSAGCALATRLSEVPDWRVLLLESGPEPPPLTEVPALFPYPVVTNNLTDILFTRAQTNGAAPFGSVALRGRMLGGSSGVNGMIYVRGSRHDYDRWAAAGNPGWAYEEVLPYFKKAENNLDPDIAADTRHHGTGGPLSVQRLTHDANTRMLRAVLEQELGLPHVDTNGAEQLGPGGAPSSTLYQFTSSRGRRRDTFRAYLRPVRASRPNLHVETHAHVTRVLFDGDRAVGVRYRGVHGLREARAAREVVLSAGTYGSAQLLMLSGVGPAAHLREMGVNVRRDLPVGRSLQEHVTSAALVFLQRADTSEYPGSEAERWRELRQWQANATGPLASPNVHAVGGFLRTQHQDADDPRPDIQLHVAGLGVDPRLWEAGGLANVLRAGCRYPYTTDLAHYNVLLAMPVLVRPRSRGWVRLQSRDPLRPPALHPNLLGAAREVDALAEGLRWLSAALGRSARLRAAGWRQWVPPAPPCAALPRDGLPYFRCVARFLAFGFSHGTGTCRMGPQDDPATVVDSELRVRGLDGLRVCDLSVVPDAITGNPNAAAIMIAEKAADMIKAAHGAQ